MQIKNFKTIASTNTYALEHFEEFDDFSAITADIQTQGRGRFSRVWVSCEEENVYLSLILKPENTRYVTNLTQYMSVVVANVVEAFGVNPKIKWPNDVLVNGKKLCGILCESKMKNNKIRGVVLGVGINLNMPQDIISSIGRPATSLNLEVGAKIDRQKFLEKLILEFEKGYEKVISQGFLYFQDEYLKRVDFLGKKIFVQQRDGADKEEFTAIKLDENGNLVVLTAENIEKTIFSGDLIL